MNQLDLRPECVRLIKALSGDRADRFVESSLLPALGKAVGLKDPTEVEVLGALQNGYKCLAAIYSHYAFSRRGKDRGHLSEIALEALKRTTTEDDFGLFLSRSDASTLWENFVVVAKEMGHKPMEQLNRGVIAGMAELAQEIFEIDQRGSIATWITDGIRKTGRLEPQFFRIVDVRGIGPKLTSLLLRDIVYLSGLENSVETADRIYIQPIDKWIRLLAPYVIDEEDAEAYADWILAGKIFKYTRRAGVSPVRFNMGATWFGMREVRVQENLERAVNHLVSGKATS